ncbi:antibiotic biosynthesis monooxygenase [Maritimibacter sp. 55A14]|uniref:antibiotic biosynthesis monooxygenase family protein n=1 Tax=Maritimibacter sp. 55A14 TaxID=2174844 RepID=UPI000D612ED9|nr:antibiotic biosynthesis monooxygenase [Maritimibacter sp. 55A14]PWE34301.1 antibiotic biosynthesis monooxygenase [Maritimibacter sp. 55A14]
MSHFAPLPVPPYHAVIFTAQRREGDRGYAEMSAEMSALAERQPGYLGMESSRDGEGFGITVSYWADEAALLNWKAVAKHLMAQRLGRTRWYSHYRIRVARVERAYEGPEGR